MYYRRVDACYLVVADVDGFSSFFRIFRLCTNGVGFITFDVNLGLEKSCQLERLRFVVWLLWRRLREV